MIIADSCARSGEGNFAQKVMVPVSLRMRNAIVVAENTYDYSCDFHQFPMVPASLRIEKTTAVADET